MDKELKNCPFCGGKVSMRKNIVNCNKCGYGLLFDHKKFYVNNYSNRYKMMRDIWNNRVNDISMDDVSVDDTVWIVTYVDNGEATPVPFDNQEAANKCYQWLKDHHEWVGLDECEIWITFGG